MERLLLWQLNDVVLANNPLSMNQHAFRKGRSTESALSDMVGRIEGALNKNEFALGVFLDIQGAFDNVRPESIIQGMKDKGIGKHLIDWYDFFLRNRRMEVEHQGVNIEKYLTLGTPQGGVLSPVMWNLAFDSLLHLFDEGFVRVCGFADDAGLIVCGKNPNVLMSRMQKAVDKALEWGRKAGLTFSPPKTVSVLFTRKRKFDMPPELKMGDDKIPFSDTVKYLGITLDTKLSWKAHLKNKLRMAKGLLLKVRNAMGKLWGLPPKMARWMYTGIVRPALTYGALVWSKTCETEWAKKELTRLNRLALMTMGHFRRGTPTAGLEVITYVMPLHLHVKCEAALALRRTQGIASGNLGGPTRKSKTNIGHRIYCQKFLDELGVSDMENDLIPDEIIWQRSFRVDTQSFLEGKPDGEQCDYEIYTDGSRHNEMTGSGVAIFEKGVISKEMAYHLGTHATVFQAEVHAIKTAADWINSNHRYKSITVYIDSQAALYAVKKYTVTSKLVKSTIETLNESGNKNFVSLRWVKAHVGHPGNEKADELAKKGASDRSLLSGDLPAVSINFVKNHLRSKFEEHWSEIWHKRIDCRQTKQWLPAVNRILSYQVLDTDRRVFSSLVQLITGHNFLKRHSALLKEIPDADCRLCLEEE